MNKYTAIIVLLFFFAIPVFSSGEGAVELAENGNDSIPVTRVALYTAGLAQIVHETTVNGDEVISFPVEPKDINDILKSLIVEDMDGGTVDVVNFSSSDPVSVSLEDLRVNPSGSPSLNDFLKRTQGESVVVTTDSGTFQGRIFSVETSVEDNRSVTKLNLAGNSGIQAVDISKLENLRFSDPQLQKEIVSALGMISDSRVKSVRILKISCRGNGNRRIRLSYIRAVPLWKTSYRIIINTEGVLRLEGWAIVQNTGSQNWENIKLSFVAGRPNAFIMDLATPKYVARKMVETASPEPFGPASYEKASLPESLRAKSMANSGASSRAMDDYDMEAEAPYNPAPVVPRAAGVREGNFYRYDVKLPVTVKARSSGMIPVIMQKDAGRTIGIFDPDYGKVFKGVRLENKTDAHWASGPVTVIEGRYYGGDALLPDMIPGSSRILTYAVHGTLDVEKTEIDSPGKITALKIADGILYRTDKMVRKTRYSITGDEDELILIHPKEAGWKLIQSPEVTEETPSEYRFSLHDWNKPVTVEEEFVVSNSFRLSGFSYSDLAVYMEWENISPELKKSMEKIVDLKRNVENITREINSLKTRTNTISRDQARIRENMKVLDKKSDLFKRYAGQLDSQEAEFEKIDVQIERRLKELKTAEDKLKNYIISLDV